MNRRVLLLAPFGLTVLAGAGFLAMLQREQEGKFDPRSVPSQLIGKHVPPFKLPGDPGFASTDLAGQPILVNFFASWCVPCIEESGVLMGLKQAGVVLYGIAYKDKPANTDTFLAEHGDPYAKLARDEPGRVAIDWGVTGVPETYLVDKGGIVRARWVGPLTPDTVMGELEPLLRHYA
jgi:cytochrome c biogenesis protein CcmG, thiol:disulfide interchange protein DsbE